MITPIEKRIVDLLEAKDEKAISLLYDHYADALFGIAQQITQDEAIAGDVIQESFVKIWKKSDTYDASKAKLFTWLVRIVRNTAIDKIRSSSKKTKKEIQIDASDVYDVGIEGINPDAMDVQEHLGQMDNKYRVVLEALFFMGMTQQEASEELDIPLGTVKSRLKIALRELRKIYT